MYKVTVKVVGVSLLALTLSACSSMFSQQAPTGTQVAAAPGEERPIELSGAPVADTAPLAGNIEASMDGNDRTKLSRALDGGIGKQTRWTSSGTGITYTVVPTQKITVGGNSLCRKYTITAIRGASTQQVSGSACVGSDGAWHTV